jgi:hypothetical protein
MNSIWTTGRTSLGLGWSELVFGAWLVISPFALGFTYNIAGTVNNIAVGLAIILLTVASTRNGLFRALIVLLGAWVYASGFILDLSKGIFIANNLVLAVLIIAAAVASESPYPENHSRRSPRH